MYVFSIGIAVPARVTAIIVVTYRPSRVSTVAAALRPVSATVTGAEHTPHTVYKAARTTQLRIACLCCC